MAEGTTVGSINYDLSLDDAKFNKSIDSVDKKVNSIGDRFKSAEAGSQAFAAGIAGIGVAMVGFGASSVMAFNESEKVTAQLDAVLASTKEVMSQQDKTTTSTRLSAAATAELGGKLADANARLHDMESRWSKTSDHTETATRSLEKARAEVAKLSAELGHAGDTITSKFIAPTQMSREALIKLSATLQQTSTFSDEAILSAENLLLTFTSIGKKVFPEATQAVLDLSVALRQDTKTSAIQLGKALNNPIIGVGALRKVGVSFTEDQQKLIEKLVTTGHLLEAQKIILKELATEVGGSDAAAAKTFSGQLTILKNNFNDFQEVVGKAITDRLRPLIMVFNDWMKAMGGPDGMMKSLTENLTAMIPFMPVIIGFIIGGLIPAFVGLATSVWATMAPLIPFLAIGAAIGFIIKLLVEHFGGLEVIMGKLEPTWAFLVTLWETKFLPALKALWAQISTELIPALMELWNVLAPILIPLLQGLAILFGTTLLVVIYAFIAVLRFLVAILTGLVFIVQVVASEVIKWFKDMATKVALDVGNMILDVVDWFKALPGRITSGLAGLYESITRPFREAFNEIKKLAEQVWESLQKVNPFHRNSPSLVDNVIKGVGMIKTQYASLNDITLPTLSASVGGGENEQSMANNTNMPVNIYIDKVNDQQDVTAIGRELGFRAGLL